MGATHNILESSITQCYELEVSATPMPRQHLTPQVHLLHGSAVEAWV